MLAVKAGCKYIVKAEYNIREEVSEVRDVILSHTRDSGHPDKCGRIFCLQEVDSSINIRWDWTALEVEVSEGRHHE